MDLVKILDFIGSVYFDKGDYLKALDIYERKLRIVTKAKGKGKDLIIVAKTLNFISLIHHKKKKY